MYLLGIVFVNICNVTYLKNIFFRVVCNLFIMQFLQEELK